MQMISYAQNSEDVILRRVFEGKPKGFYVDVGAHHPSICSVTKHFYDQGWSGINIEPGTIFTELTQQRSKDINLPLAVSDQEGTTDFYEFTDMPGESSLNREVVDLANSKSPRKFQIRKVRTRPLHSIFAEYLPPNTEIDFMSVDVEKHELQVLRSNDWNRFRPRVILVEATLAYSNTLCHQQWEPILLNADYCFAFFDGINRFYVRAEDRSLLKHFEYPVNILDQFIPVEQYRLGQIIQQNYTDQQMTLQELSQVRGKYQITLSEKNNLDKEKENLQQLLNQSRVQIHEQSKKIESMQEILTTWLHFSSEQRAIILKKAYFLSPRWLKISFALGNKLKQLAKAIKKMIQLPKRAVKKIVKIAIGSNTQKTITDASAGNNDSSRRAA